MVEDQEKISYTRAYEIAVGKLGISPAYFLHKMTPRAFNHLLNGYNEKYEDVHYHWRVLTYYLAKPNFKVGEFENFHTLKTAATAGARSSAERFDFLVDLFGMRDGIKLNKKEYGIR